MKAASLFMAAALALASGSAIADARGRGAGEKWVRALLGGAPVESLAASEDGRAIAIAGLAGVYLSLDGGKSWTRDARVDPYAMKCGPMDVAFRADGLLRFRCVAPDPPGTRCMMLPLSGGGKKRCAAADTRTEPAFREAKRVVEKAESAARASLGIPAGSPLPVLFHPGLDGLAAVRITPDVSGKVEAVFVDFAAPLADFMVHEGDPWVFAGRARCVSHREGWHCVWETRPGREGLRRIGATPLPKALAGKVMGGPPRPILSAYPLRDRPVSLVGTARGLFLMKRD